MFSSIKYCRLCLNPDKWNSPVPIFEGSSRNRDSLGKAIVNFAEVTISEDDGLPNVICHNCLGILTVLIGFKDTIQKNDRFLKNMVCSVLSKNRTNQNASIVRMNTKMNVKSSNVGGVLNSFDIIGSDSNSNQTKSAEKDIIPTPVALPTEFQSVIDGTKIKLKKKKSRPKPKPKPLQVNQDPKDLQFSNKAQLFFCEMCNRPFRRIKEKYDHVKICHSTPNKEYFACVFCTMTYMDKISVDCHKKLYHPFLSEEVFNQKEREIRCCLKNPIPAGPHGDTQSGQLNGPERIVSSMQPDFDLIEEIKTCDKSSSSKKRKQDNKVRRSRNEDEIKKRRLDYISSKPFDDTENTIHETIVEVHAPMNSNDSFENNENSNQENSVKSTSDNNSSNKDNIINNEENSNIGEKSEDPIRDKLAENEKEGEDKIEVDCREDKEEKVKNSESSMINDNSDNKDAAGEDSSTIQASEAVNDANDICDADETEKTNEECPEFCTDKKDETSNSDIKNADEKRAYLCNVCSSRFESMKELFYHKKVHK